MHMENVKIDTILKGGFASLLFFVIVLTLVSSLQSAQLYRQTEIMYNHPMKVRSAIGTLTNNALKQRLATRDLALAVTEQERQEANQEIVLSDATVTKQFKLLDELYLGPPADVDRASTDYLRWRTVRDEYNNRLLATQIFPEEERTAFTDRLAALHDRLLVSLKTIDDFAQDKSDALYANSKELQHSLTRQLLLLTAVILLLSISIASLVRRSIRRPLAGLTETTRRFHNGDLDARCPFQSTNEFGVLSAAFNSMIESIQASMVLNDKVVKLAEVMLREENDCSFFHAILKALHTHTGSQMAAVYLLAEDKTTFDHFHSIGIADTARLSFAANHFEGEFGAALSTNKVQHLKNIPADTRFVFHTVSGSFIPQEIITIPILVDNEIIAITSLASVSCFSKQSLAVIDNILPTLSARIGGILASRKIREISEQLAAQNMELESQKTELTMQSSELTEQNAQLEMQKQQLGEASRLKTNFLSNMSHELRTPLNSVIALSGVLNRRLVQKIPAEEYSYLEVIERNGRHLLALINDILDISRIEAGREEVEICTVNTNDLIEEVVSMILPEARQRQIELLQTDGAPELTITSDPRKCRHILQNLIGNAVKFTEQGKVVVTARQRGANIEITVTDTGIGIAAHNLPHIFDQFRQADSSTSRKFGGTGLGLAIARQYANLLGGTITVRSTKGEGSEFTLTLPLEYRSTPRIPEAEAAAGRNQRHPPSTTTSSAVPAETTILLIEDNESAIIQMKDILEEKGYRMLIAHEGNEALGILAHTTPHAIILDLMMPGVDGFHVLRAIRESASTVHVPVLILTAKHITKEELNFLKHNNIFQLIQKGEVQRGELLDVVAAMVVSLQKPEPPGPLPSPPLPTENPRILVVEDNPDNMLTMKALLARKNFMVLEALNGQDGVELARSHRPDLILMDIELPILDGIEAFRIIRSQPQLQHVPVIAVTASAMASDREAILAHGFDGYLPKPIDEHVLFKTIGEVLYGK